MDLYENTVRVVSNFCVNSPLVALIREANGIYEGKFVLATISLESQVPEVNEEIADEHVSGTEDELDDTTDL